MTQFCFISRSLLSTACTLTRGCGVLRLDPIFKDFAGRSWEFLGQAGKIYNILSANEGAVVNMQLVEAGPRHIRQQQGEGTFAGAMAFLVNGMRILASVDEAGSMTGRPVRTACFEGLPNLMQACIRLRSWLHVSTTPVATVHVESCAS